MKIRSALVFIACASTCSGACSSSTPVASPLLELGPIPAEATLCQLTPHRSTASDVRTVLGMPTTSNAFSDGTSVLSFDYDAGTTPNQSIAILGFCFTMDQVFATADAQNMVLPSCWHFDFDAGF